MSFSFKGNQIAIIGTRAATYGKMRVYLNGSTTPIATINSYSATSQFKQTLATIRVPGNVDAAHTIRIVAELDTVGHTVCIDRVDVTGVNPRLERWFDTVASTEHFTTTYEHNALGQRTASIDPYATTNYLWTGQRLSNVQSPYGDNEYAYDGAGQRLRKTLTQGDEVTTTSYLYDGLDLLSLTESSEDSEQTLTYLYADNTTPIGALYQSSEATQAITFEIVPDSRGDVREMRDMQGSTFARFDYDAHGNIRAEEVFETDLIDEETAQIITDLQPLRYAGYVWDAEIQLYYCSQRYYDPTIGAFISKDPIKADGELSFYAYGAGDPINRIDPSGLDYIARQMAANRAAQQRAHWQAYQRAMTQRYPMAALRSAENRVRNGWATSGGSTWSGYSSGKYSPAYIPPPPPQPCTVCHSLIDRNGNPIGSFRRYLSQPATMAGISQVGTGGITIISGAKLIHAGAGITGVGMVGSATPAKPIAAPAAVFGTGLMALGITAVAIGTGMGVVGTANLQRGVYGQPALPLKGESVLYGISAIIQHSAWQ